MTADVDGHDVDQREHKHPDQIDKVPVETADLHVFVFQLLYARDYREINGAGGDVKHVQAGDREEGGAEKWRRRFHRS